MEKLMLESISDYKVEEAIKRLTVNLTGSYPEAKKIVVTSIAGKEGKSFVSLQMAKVMAGKGKKTIFINGDLRMGMLEQAGLAEYLQDDISLDKVIYETEQKLLKIIPAGKSRLTIINEERLEKLLKELSASYDYIIIDSPSVGEVADAMTMGGYCDGILLVLEPDIVEEKMVRRVKEEIERNGCKILGVVLNKSN